VPPARTPKRRCTGPPPATTSTRSTPSSTPARTSRADGAGIAGCTPLDDGVAFGQWQTARRLVERGAYASQFNSAALGLLDRVQAHLAHDPPPGEVTAAFWAACHGGQRATAEDLLRRGADLNWIAPWDGLTPLDAAQRSEAHDLAAWLTTHGARSAAAEQQDRT
jgi:uncharacterized protein